MVFPQGNQASEHVIDWNWEEVNLLTNSIRIRNYVRPIIVSFAVLFFFLAALTPVWGVRGGPRIIEEVEVKEPGIWQFQGGFRFESSRKLTEQNQEFDNIRLHDVGIRWGMTDFLEIGADFSFSSNSADGAYPDQSDVERTNLRLKIPWHDFFSSTIRVGFAEGQDVQPFGGEDVDAGINFPFRFPFAQGQLHGQIGADFQSGDVEGLGGSDAEWEDSVRYGLGYVFDVHRLATMSVELDGQTAPADGENLDFEDHLELNIGSQLHLSPKSRLSPHVGFGLLDGSPDFAVGVGYEIEFGRRYQPKDTMDKPLPEDRYVRPMNPKKSESAPPTTTRNQRSPEREMDVESGQVRSLIEQGRNAFRRGNLNDAIQKFRQAERLAPSSLIIQSNLASLYFRNEQYRRARQHYRNAIDINSNDEFSHYYLGLTYYRLGERERARTQLRRVLRLNPDHEDARRWLERIQ